MSDELERLRAERDALRANEARYRLLFEGNPVPMFVYDVQTLHVVDVNPAALAKYDWTRAELLSMRIFELAAPESRAGIAAMLDDPRRIRSHGPWKHLLRSGETIEVELVSAPLTWNGRDARMVMTIDVTDRTRAEERAEAARAQLMQVFERVTDAFVALDRQWRYTYVNARAGALFGRDPARLIGRHIWTEFPEGEGQPFHRRYEQALDTQQPVFFEDYYAPWDRWFENRVYPSADGLSIFFHDITDRKRAEAERDEHAHRNAALVTALGQIVYDWRPPTGELIWGGDYAKLLGYSAQEMGATTESWLERVHPDDLPRVQDELGQATGARRNYDLEYRFRHRDGSWRWMHDRGVLTIGAAGALERVIGVFTDVTERRRAQQLVRDQLDELRRWHAAMLDREDRAMALKREVNELLAELGRSPRYPSQSGDPAA